MFKIIIFGVLLILLLNLSCDTLMPIMSPEERKEVKQFCTNLPSPLALKQKVNRKVEKEGAVVYVSIYTSDISLSEVDEFYSDLLIKDGWKRTASSDLLKTFIDFKKGKYVIEIEFDKVDLVDTSKNYAVSCSYDK